MEVRYYLASKQSWNDVTVQVSKTSDVLKVGDVVRLGKIPMHVCEIKDGRINGRLVTKVYLESISEEEANLLESLSQMKDTTIIKVSEQIDEAKKKPTNISAGFDDRVKLSAIAARDTTYSTPFNIYGPGSNRTLGGYFRTGLANIGAGFSTQVSDFGIAVVVNITYSNTVTGRTAGQNFVVIFDTYNKRLPYRAYSSTSRFRDCSSYDQAISYIRSKASALPGATSSAI